MPAAVEFGSAVSLVTLREVRGFIRRSHAVAMTVAFVLMYGLLSMLLGGMLLFARIPGGYSGEILWGSAGGQSPWNYPGVLVVAPWGVVTLPFFATLSMVVVSVGVGIGMAVAVLLVVALFRARRFAEGKAAGAGSIAGLTPAMIALVTLGACCSTTAAATAGVGLVAGVSGAATDTLLLNNWFLGLFQMVVVWIALLAQELILRVYGGILGIGGRGATTPDSRASPPGVRSAVGAVLRAALLIGGVTWSMAMFAQWTVTDPSSATVGVWAGWLLVYQVPAGLAIGAAFFPRAVYRGLTTAGPRWVRTALRSILLVAGGALLVGAPPLLLGGAPVGLLGELLGGVGVGAGGGVGAPSALGAATLFRWLWQYLLLGLFSVVAAVAPRFAFAPVLFGDTLADSGSTDPDASPVPAAGPAANLPSNPVPSNVVPPPLRVEGP